MAFYLFKLKTYKKDIKIVFIIICYILWYESNWFWSNKIYNPIFF